MLVQHLSLRLDNRWDRRVALSFLERNYQELGTNIYNSYVNGMPFEVTETIASLRCIPARGQWEFDYVASTDATYVAVSKMRSTPYTLDCSVPEEHRRAQDIRVRALAEPHFSIVDGSVDGKPFVFRKDGGWNVPEKGILKMSAQCIDSGEEIRSDEDTRNIVTQLVKVKNPIERMSMFREIVGKSHFTVHQAKIAVRAFSNQSEVIEGILLIQPRLVDPHRLSSLLKLVQAEEDRDLIRSRLKATVGV